jgi:membrane-associated phospholipid phosphatase
MIKSVLTRRQLLINLVILTAFTLLAIRVNINDRLPLDEILVKVPHQIFSSHWDPIFRVIYFGTGVKVTAVIVACTLIFLAWKRYWLEAKVLAFSTLGILILVDQIMKPIISRSRPSDRLVHVVGRSFPSGHATGNILFYYFVAYLLAERFPQLTIYIYSLATTLLILIGFSSVYLRVHWPADIVAGYGLGYVCLTISLGVLEMLRRKNY